MPTPTPTPIATPLLGVGAAVVGLLGDSVGVVVVEDVMVAELLVLLALLAVKIAEGSIVVTTVPAFKVKAAEGSEQLQPPNP